MINIEPIVKYDLCTQCGTCLAVCPVDAIKLKQHQKRGLIPIVDESICIGCRKCVKVCPGDRLDMDLLQRQVFGKVPSDLLFGECLAIYSGYSNDPEFRYNGASGGAVSTILIQLLEQKIIDGALVVKMGCKRPLEPEILIAKNRQEIMDAQQSKYIPVPLNAGLKSILDNPDKKYAMTALPCHLHGLRLLERLVPHLKDQIVLRIGLLCGFNPTLNSTKYLLNRAGVPDNKFNDIQKIKYRDGDWPCGFRVLMKDGSDHFLYPIKEFLYSHYVFERQRCAMCRDHSAELADISVGDEWRLDIKNSAEGWSFIIPRTPIGQTILNQMVDQGHIYIEATTKEAILSGQAGTIRFKKYGSFAFARVRKWFGRRRPDYLKKPMIIIPPRYYIGAILVFCFTSLFNLKVLRKLALLIPTYFFTKYRWLLYKLYRD